MRYRVNLDFDAALSFNDPNYQNDKFVRELEYIFMLTNEDPTHTLCTRNAYSKEYLSHLRECGFIIPNFSKDISNYENWWGDLRNFELGKKLNSKCWLATWHTPLNDKIIKCLEDIKLDSPAYYRSDQGFSGINNKIIRSERDVRNLRFPGVISRFVNVIKTFGVTYNLVSNDFFIIENIVDANGKFNGGRLINISDLDIPFDLNLIIEKIRTNLPSSDIEVIQFDNMIYKDEDREHALCPLVEINYRKTMAIVVQSVTQKLGPGTLYFGTKDYLSPDSIILSPSNVRNVCYYNRA